MSKCSGGTDGRPLALYILSKVAESSVSTRWTILPDSPDGMVLRNEVLGRLCPAGMWACRVASSAHGHLQRACLHFI